MTLMTPPCGEVAEPSHEPLPDHGNGWRLQFLYGEAHRGTKGWTLPHLDRGQRTTNGRAPRRGMGGPPVRIPQ
jgi:hypothetical protein